MEESWPKELWKACPLNEGVALADLEEVYAVMEAGVLLRYRPVPYKMYEYTPSLYKNEGSK